MGERNEKPDSYFSKIPPPPVAVMKNSTHRNCFIQVFEIILQLYMLQGKITSIYWMPICMSHTELGISHDLFHLNLRTF